MRPKKNQSNPLKLTAEQIAKASQAKKRAEAGKVELDNEWMFIAEFGYYFGYEGIRAILDNEIDLSTAKYLLDAARKVWFSKAADMAHGSFIAAAAAQSKKPAAAFKKGIASFIKAMRVN
jgi:hypothetical protein